MAAKLPTICKDQNFQELCELLVSATYVSSEVKKVELLLETPQDAERFFHLMGLIPTQEELEYGDVD